MFLAKLEIKYLATTSSNTTVCYLLLYLLKLKYSQFHLICTNRSLISTSFRSMHVKMPLLIFLVTCYWHIELPMYFTWTISPNPNTFPEYFLGNDQRYLFVNKDCIFNAMYMEEFFHIKYIMLMKGAPGSFFTNIFLVCFSQFFQ